MSAKGENIRISAVVVNRASEVVWSHVLWPFRPAPNTRHPTPILLLDLLLDQHILRDAIVLAIFGLLPPSLISQGESWNEVV